MRPRDLVLCRSCDGWSLHPPGTEDSDIAEGDAILLLDGDYGHDEHGEETRPSRADYAEALRRLAAGTRQGPHGTEVCA